MLEILPIPAYKDNYIWLLKELDGHHATIVDPGEAEPVLQFLQQNNLTPVAILITHHHWDHVSGIQEIKGQYDIPVITPANETVTASTRHVAEKDIVDLAELNCQLRVLDVPGHTAGAVAYYSDNLLFSGDTLFTAGCGRMFEGTAPQMYASLCKLKSLPGSVQLYCGHEYTEANLRFAITVEPTNSIIKSRIARVRELRKQGLPTVPASLAIEKQTNPFLRCDNKNVIAAVSAREGKNLSEPAEVFAALRRWKDDF